MPPRFDISVVGRGAGEDWRSQSKRSGPPCSDSRTRIANNMWVRGLATTEDTEV